MNPVLQQLLTADSGIGLCWLGNLGWLLCADGKLIATDLGLDRSSRLFPSPIPTAELAPHLDLHFITHEHRDHFSGPTSEILGPRTAPVSSSCRPTARDVPQNSRSPKTGSRSPSRTLVPTGNPRWHRSRSKESASSRSAHFTAIPTSPYTGAQTTTIAVMS